MLRSSYLRRDTARRQIPNAEQKLLVCVGRDEKEINQSDLESTDRFLTTYADAGVSQQSSRRPPVQTFKSLPGQRDVRGSCRPYIKTPTHHQSVNI